MPTSRRQLLFLASVGAVVPISGYHLAGVGRATGSPYSGVSKQQLDALVSAYRNRLAQQESMTEQMLAEWIENDFTAGRVILIDGWVLAETEVAHVAYTKDASSE